MSKPLKIYFACAIKGEPGGQEDKQLILSVIKQLGHTVLTEVFLDPNQNLSPIDGQELTSDQIYHRDMNWIYEADLIVADVSRISLGVGFEIGWMLGRNGRVLTLCKKDMYDKLSSMIKGCRQPGFSLHVWKDRSDIEQILTQELGQPERDSIVFNRPIQAS